MPDFDYVIELTASPFTISAMRKWMVQHEPDLGAYTFHGQYRSARATFERLSDALHFDITWLTPDENGQIIRTARPEPTLTHAQA